ncbi:MAG TPA: AMP-binding protein, partial [Acidimicrobiia bacterium]|nr:AMP-binding protein [Acidimicrobiia bacterium]
MTRTTLAGLFDDALAAAPDAVALVTDAGRLTFAELDAAANRLARELIDLGAGPGDLVVLALPRAEMVPAILAAAKAGPAFVPVDPDHASERLGLVLDDAGRRGGGPIALGDGGPGGHAERDESEQDSESDGTGSERGRAVA